MTLTKTLSISLLGALAFSANGCALRECTEEERVAAAASDDATCGRIEPFERFVGSDEEELSVDWESGDHLLVEGAIRELEIIEGSSSDTVEVTYQPLVDLATGRTQEVVEATMDNLTNSLESVDGTIVVSSSRGDSGSNLGSIVLISLPSDWDGDVNIDIMGNLPGDMDLDFLGEAKALTIDKDSLGDLEVDNPNLLEEATINVRGDILTGSFSADNLFGAVVHTTIGDINTAFSDVPSVVAKIVADFGDIEILLPDTGDYTMQVVAEDGVMIDDEPNACVIDDDEENAQSMTCGDGDDDRTTFEIDADGEVEIGFL